MLKQRVKASISSKSDIEDTRLDIALDYVLAGTIDVYKRQALQFPEWAMPLRHILRLVHAETAAL